MTIKNKKEAIIEYSKLFYFNQVQNKIKNVKKKMFEVVFKTVLILFQIIKVTIWLA
jgi:hypothetical protein